MYSRIPRQTFWREWATRVDYKNFTKGPNSQVLPCESGMAEVHCTAKFKYVHLTNPVSQVRKCEANQEHMTQGSLFILGYQSYVNRIITQNK